MNKRVKRFGRPKQSAFKLRKLWSLIVVSLIDWAEFERGWKSNHPVLTSQI
jgi:hypothetical protein